MESIINKSRINHANRGAKTKKYIPCKIIKSTHKGTWKEVTDKIADDIGITMEDKVCKMHTSKRKTKNKMENKILGKAKRSGRQKV